MERKIITRKRDHLSNLNKLKTIAAGAFVAAAVTLTGCSKDEGPAAPVQPQTEALIRVIHSSYDAPAVDVWIDGAKAISNLNYGASSGYATVSSGSRNVKVVPAGATTPVVIEANLQVEADKRYTVMAADKLASITPIVAEDAATASKARVRFIHSSPDAPAVDIKVGSGSGPVLFDNVAFKNVRNYVDVDPGTYNLAVTAHGSAREVVILGNVRLDAATNYTVVAKGTFMADDEYPFTVRAFVDNGNGKSYADLAPATSKIKVVHASPDAPGVDLYVDGAKAGVNLQFPDNSGYLTVPSGLKNVRVSVTRTSTDVITADLPAAPFKNYSVFAVDAVSRLGALVLEDDLSAPAAGKAHVRFVHLSPDAPAVDITTASGALVFANKSFKQFTEFTPLDAGTYNLQVRLAGTATSVLDLSNLRLESGKIYTVFAKGFVAGSGITALGAQIIVNS